MATRPWGFESPLSHLWTQTPENERALASEATTDLQVSVEETAAWSRKLVITVPAARVKSERARVTRQLSKRVRIPGFRRGKVPPKQIEARFGPDIDRQTRQQVIEGAFREAIESKSLEPISEPRVANVSYDREAELTFEVAFDIRPEITLSRIGGFRLTRPEPQVGEDEIDAHLEALRRSHGLWKPVERKPEAGDSVEVEITPLEDEAQGEAETQPYRFVLGEGSAIPEVEAAIMTLDPGTSGEFTVTFPDDFADEDKRGGSQRLRIDLKQVLEQELPPLNDEFARSVSELTDLPALRDAIAEQRRRQREREIDLQLDNQLIDQIIEANPFEVPETMVDHYVDAMIGTPPEGADPDLLSRAKEEARPAAQWGIKRTLILRRIAEDHGLQATQEEVTERIEELARRAGRTAREVRARLGKSGELRDLERRITEEKTLSFLKEQSEIKGEGQ